MLGNCEGRVLGEEYGELNSAWGEEQGLRKGINEQVRFNLGLEMNTHVAGKRGSAYCRDHEQHVQARCLDDYPGNS